MRTREAGRAGGAVCPLGDASNGAQPPSNARLGPSRVLGNLQANASSSGTPPPTNHARYPPATTSTHNHGPAPTSCILSPEQVHVYQLDTEGPAEDDDSEDNTPSYREWVLPSQVCSAYARGWATVLFYCPH